MLDRVLREKNFLVDDRFSVTDIHVSYTVNWGYDDGLIDDFPNLIAYLERLHERESCTLGKH